MARGNPAMNDAVFERYGTLEASGQRMTLQGSAIKTGILLAILLATGVFSWGQVIARSPQAIPLLFGGLIGGFVISLVTIFKPRTAPITAPIYAALEGLVLGGLSAFFEMKYPGIVINAIGVSIGVLALMLFAYATGIIPVTQKFKMAVICATGAICLMYIVSIVMSFFGMRMPLIHESGGLGIGFSVVVVIIAALNLMLDFDFIEKGVQMQMPKSMEWYAGFSLLVTLVWLYLEILRLLSKLRER